MKIKVIRTEADYEAALEQLESLLAADPTSRDADLIEVLSVLIERYEEENFPVEMPDPIEAIKFRMDQKGLKQKDLIPFMGSKGIVSEVLNHRRKLSQNMIRALHKGLGIPYEILMQDPEATFQEQTFFVDDFPFTEMVRQGYFPGYDNVRKAKLYAEELLKSLMKPILMQLNQPILCKHGNQEIDKNALLAWKARACAIAMEKELVPFQPESLNQEFFGELNQFSLYKKGVLLVEEHLNKVGIHFVLLKNLSRTYLDGASFLTPDGVPVIGLTLRYDRVDNFWFTLFHELGHLKLHLAQGVDCSFFDDTNHNGEENSDPYEMQANHFARELIVPNAYWEAQIQPNVSSMDPMEIEIHATKLGIHPALLAGQIRWAMKDFTKFSDMIGQGEVRSQFQNGGEG
jgi:HTH-type transcriptional regulator/antitoxin HigA